MMRRALAALLLLGALALAQGIGWLRPADDFLRDLRFGIEARAPSGSIVFVDIDPESLDAVGVWPWPRRVHAQLLERLMEMNAAEVAFDIDFSQPSNPEDDALFAASLEAAGGYALLAAFQQMTADAGEPVYTVPLPQFSQHASPALVNVAADAVGTVRQMPVAMPVAGRLVASLPAALAGVALSSSNFAIDYSIAAGRIDRIPAKDILSGAVNPERIANRQVVIGASALELRDVMMTPSQGALPGAVIQILAAESLKQGRALVPAPPPTALAALFVVGLLMIGLGQRLATLGGMAAAASIVVVTELGASALQLQTGVLLDTVAFDMMVVLSVVMALGLEAFERRRLHVAAARERAEALEQLAESARRDALTGALTRHEFLTRVDAMLAAAPATLLAISLRRFARVNEALGHQVADLVLCEVTRRMRGLVPFGEVARLAGDNFAVAVPAHGDGEALAKRLMASLRERMSVDRHEVLVGCVIGITSSAGGDADAETLLLRAEMARSAAVADKAHDIVGYEPAMEARTASGRVIELALQEAIEERTIELYYQGQFDLRTGALAGVEALARWRHPKLGVIPPNRFVALAEETGLALALGAHIMRTACNEVARWPSGCRLAVNVSPAQIELGDLVALVRACLAESGLAPARLDLEITEGLLLAATPRTLETLDAVRALGVGIALDDFGTGYSSLSYLGRLPIDKLKIDQSFVRQLMQSERNDAIVETILTLCQRLDLDAVAEGIETPEQLRWLQARQCAIGQGYLLHRPAPVDEIEQWPSQLAGFDASDVAPRQPRLTAAVAG